MGEAEIMLKICVLLSTYNGEDYIIEQLESIYKQESCEVFIVIRDDGSTDNTCKKIKEYSANKNNICLSEGKNLGYKKSFMELVYNADEIYDYYAFADQDDVWNSLKLFSATEKLKNSVDKPALYYGMMTQVDKNLNVMSEQQEFKPPVKKPMVLFQNFVQGSTIVFNRNMLLLAKKFRVPREVAHDVWLPVLATYCGKIYGDENSYIMYRKHDQAVTVNMRNNYWKDLIKDIFAGKKVENYSIFLNEGYSDFISNEDMEFIKKMVKYKKHRIHLALSKGVRKYSIKGTVLLKMAIMFGKVEV